MMTARRNNKTAKTTGLPRAANGEGTDAAPVLNEGIIKRASGLGNPSTLVFGLSATGKSTVVKQMVKTQNGNPLWLALTNAAALSDDAEVAEWGVATPADWVAYKKEIATPAIRHELVGYDTLVIDGLDVLANMALTAQAPNGQPQQADWLIASNAIRDTLVQLRSVFKHMYAILDVVPDKEGLKLNLNPYTRNNIISLFGNKYFTSTTRERDGNGKLTGNVGHLIQRNPTLALAFTPGVPVE